MDMAGNSPNAAETLNATMRKFGAPATSLQVYRHWNVLLRPAQVTLGSLVLAAFEPARALSELSRESYAELADVVRDIERALKRAFTYDKINYLLFMMVDPDVHFHVIPRYAGERAFADRTFTDPGWPGVPDMVRQVDLDDATFGRIHGHIRACWS